MSFETVTIIQYSPIEEMPTSENDVNQVYKFLVAKENSSYSFWSFSNNAIGAGFQRDLLDRKFKENFDLDLDEQFAKRFRDREYLGKNQPPTVVYRIILNEDSYNELNSKLEGESNFEWIDENDLFNSNLNWNDQQKWILEAAEEASSYWKLKKINPNFKTRINQIITAKEQGNLVIFVGAGISKSSGVPLWNELIAGLLKDLGTEDFDYEIIPQLYFQEHSETKYIQRIEDILDLENKSPNCIHSEIFKLNPSHVITTNYDSFLEDESNNQGKNYFVIRKDKDLPYSDSDKLIIKMHGDIKEKNIVLKEDDYLLYSENFKLIEHLVKSIFSSKLVLFLGFSFSDRNLKKIIESVRHVLKESFNPALLFTTKSENEIDPRQLQYFNNRGIKIVGYEETIKNFLEGEKQLPRLSKNAIESNKDFILKEKTYNFLRFINNYSDELPFEFIGQTSTAVDKMFSGLFKYQDLPVIPPKYLVKIKPFALNDDEQAKYDSFGFHLKTSSEDIIKTLSKIDRIENSQVYYSTAPNNPEEDEEINYKLNYIFKSLRSSAVLCIQRKYDFRDEVHNRLKYISDDEDCSCPTCLLSDFKFHLAHSSGLNSTHPDESHLIHLKKAKVNFFFGEYENSFQELQKGAALAFKNKNFHLYFLHIYNIKLLKYRIKGLFVPNHISKESKEKIISEIDSYIVSAIIEELYLGKLSKDILRSIDRKELYHKTYVSLKENYKRIESLYKSHKNGYSHFMGPNYVVNTIYDFRVYLHFVTGNLLFDIFYRDHEELVGIFAQAIFTSYVSHESLKQKLDCVSYYDIKPILQYSNPKELFAAIKSTLLKESTTLKLEPKEVNDFVSLIKTYVDSQFTINNFLGESLDLRENIQYVKKRHFMVEQRFRYLFDNLLIVLSQLSKQLFEHEDYIGLIEKIFKFIKIADNQPFSDKDYFNIFIKEAINYGQAINKELILEACLNDNLWSGDHIHTFVNSLSKNSEFSINNLELYQKIIHRTSKRNKYQISIMKIVPLYKHLGTSFKKEFRSQFKNNEYNFEDQTILFDEGILSKNNKNEIIDTFYDFVLTEPKFRIVSDRIFINNSNFWHLYSMFIENKIMFNKDQKTEVLNNSNLFSWLLYPSEFDYDKFELDWIKILNINSFYWEHLNSANKKITEKMKDMLIVQYDEKVSKMYWKLKTKESL